MAATELAAASRACTLAGRARPSSSVVNDVSFSVAPGEIVGIVGESGSGKTLAARAIMGLEPPAIQRTAGAIQFEGRGRHHAVAEASCASFAAPASAWCSRSR